MSLTLTQQHLQLINKTKAHMSLYTCTYHTTYSFKIITNFCLVFALVCISFTSSYLNAQEKQSINTSTDFDYLVKRFKEPQRTQLKHAISLAIQQHPGKVIGISPDSRYEQHPYRIKILKADGHIDTYYINQSFKQIKP
jgi:hypothetical protein